MYMHSKACPRERAPSVCLCICLVYRQKSDISGLTEVNSRAWSTTLVLCTVCIAARKSCPTISDYGTLKTYPFYKLRHLYSLILQNLVKPRKRHGEATFPEEAVKKKISSEFVTSP